jgi:ATP-dependent helicase/nuclease subunit A
LHQFARSFLPLYARAKEVRGWLDFDDLIARAKALLTDRSVAAWVLYRLDGGIDHILVDEAQDTSPDQWKVIELLSAEFTAGQGAQGDKQRTLFVVGDKKQSIYSFQGADVTAFDEKHALFKTGFKRVGQQFQSLDLSYSFRSAPVILNLVDAAFARHFQPALGDSIQHFAFKAALPGRVDLWPLIEPVKSEKNDEWENPVDLISDTHHTAKLAAGIAREIKVLIDSGTQLRDENGVDRAVHAGDFLILVQRRSALFAEVIAACKKAGLAIAGADRLKLGAELAVKDLAALLAFLATPEDDLSLAALLRSPLCGWTEDELYQLAQGRKGYLWESLRNHEAHVETRLMLNDLRAQADFLRPFDLLERALTRHDGRRRLLARLGDEAEDGIDELLSQAFSYETNDVPSLTGFLIWLETDDVIVKRQVDSAGKRIRVMTVHGAKGLEAPIVILPDTCDRSPQDRDEIYRTDDGFPIWKTPSEASPITVSEIRVQRKFQANAESARLLYVALTRARSWLIVAGAGEAKTEVKNAPKPVAEWCWYRIVESGMRALGALPYEHGRLRLSNGNWPTNQPPEKQVETAAQPVPEWALLAAKPVAHPASAVSPSNLGGAKVLPAEDDALSGDLAKARGTALHRLLEHLPMLPRKDWPAVATLLVPDASLCAELYFEAVCALDNPDLAWVFGPDTMAEVPFTAALGAGLVEGKLDRLQVAPDCVRLVDFKSNAVVPPNAEMVPEGLLRQMGAYAAAFGQIYPDRRIETFILWTRTATLMPLDADIVSAALLRATIP